MYRRLCTTIFVVTSCVAVTALGGCSHATTRSEVVARPLVRSELEYTARPQPMLLMDAGDELGERLFVDQSVVRTTIKIETADVSLE